MSARQAPVYKHSLVLRCCKYLLSLSSRVHGLFKSSRQVVDQSVFTNFLAASCHCLASLPLLSLLPSWSVPREKCPNSPAVQWFRSALHPSRCPRPMLAIVCSAPPTSARVDSCDPWYILYWSVGFLVSRIQSLQTCNIVVVLKHRLAFFQHPHNFSL